MKKTSAESSKEIFDQALADQNAARHRFMGDYVTDKEREVIKAKIGEIIKRLSRKP